MGGLTLPGSPPHQQCSHRFWGLTGAASCCHSIPQMEAEKGPNTLGWELRSGPEWPGSASLGRITHKQKSLYGGAAWSWVKQRLVG